MKPITHHPFRLAGLPLGVFTLTLALPLATLAPSVAVAVQPDDAPPAMPVVVQNFPELQTTETASQPFIATALAHFPNPDYSVAAGSFSVPPGMALVLDGASADLHGVIVDTTRMVKVRLKITFFPNEPPLTQVVNVATDFKPVTVDLGGAFTSTAVSWALPPMHLPPGTEVQVSVMQNAVTNSPDYGVLVTGHLVPAIATE